MSVIEPLQRVVLVIGMLAALTAGSALTRPPVAVIASEVPGLHAGAIDERAAESDPEQMGDEEDDSYYYPSGNQFPTSNR